MVWGGLGEGPVARLGSGGELIQPQACALAAYSAYGIYAAHGPKLTTVLTLSTLPAHLIFLSSARS